jgi:hypothetical protein
MVFYTRGLGISTYYLTCIDLDLGLPLVPAYPR